MVRIRAFRAVSDFASCQKFIEGHRRVLTSIGVEVSSAKHEWAYNPAAFVILVESMEDGRALGGARIHAVGGTQPLPIEEAVGDIDSKIYGLVEKHQANGTGELCGLWNSVEVAGMGIGSVFLIRSAVAITTQIGLNTLFALCSPYTTRMCANFSFQVEKTIGNSGTFYYPKMNLLATVAIIPDLDTLPGMNSAEQERVFDLRKNPNQKTMEASKRADLDTGKKGRIPVEYELAIPDANRNEFKMPSQQYLTKLSPTVKTYASECL